MGFSQARIRHGLPFPSPGYLPDAEIKLGSAALAGRFFTAEPPIQSLKIKIWYTFLDK